jgi:hypothetical protein
MPNKPALSVFTGWVQHLEAPSANPENRLACAEQVRRLFTTIRTSHLERYDHEMDHSRKS